MKLAFILYAMVYLAGLALSILGVLAVETDRYQIQFAVNCLVSLTLFSWRFKTEPVLKNKQFIQTAFLTQQAVCVVVMGYLCVMSMTYEPNSILKSFYMLFTGFFTVVLILEIYDKLSQNS